jgi:predicted nucleic acid-binding protein
MKMAFDTNVLVAALVQPHPHHSRAIKWLKRAVSKEFDMIIAAHTIAELYAVLTTLPVSPRIFPEIAWRLIHESIEPVSTVVALSTSDYLIVMKDIKDSALSGGTVYDALILKAALKSKAGKLLTMNSSDYRRLPHSEGIEIIEP